MIELVAIVLLVLLLVAIRAVVTHRDNAEALQRECIRLRTRSPQYIEVIREGYCIIKGTTPEGCSVDFIVNNYRIRFKNMPYTIACDGGALKHLSASEDWSFRLGTNDETPLAIATLQRHLDHTTIELRKLSLRQEVNR